MRETQQCPMGGLGGTWVIYPEKRIDLEGYDLLKSLQGYIPGRGIRCVALEDILRTLRRSLPLMKSLSGLNKMGKATFGASSLTLEICKQRLHDCHKGHCERLPRLD